MPSQSKRLPEFEVFMWITSTPYRSPPEKVRKAFRRFRQMGCTGGMVCAGRLQNCRKDHSLDYHLADEFSFYVGNLCPALYAHWGEGKKSFQQYEEFGRTRDRTVFTKVPSLNDPPVLDEQRALVRSSVEDLLSPRPGARAMGLTETAGTGAMFVNPIGKGLVVLLNVIPDHYSTDRLLGGGEVWRRLAAMLTKAARVRPLVRATDPAGTPLVGWKRAVFRHGKALLVGLVGETGLRQGALGAAGTIAEATL